MVKSRTGAAGEWAPPRAKAAAERYTIEAAARQLREAWETGQPCPPLHRQMPADDVKLGYAIQDINTRLWIAEGRKLVGRKIGLTSPAVQAQLGVERPDYGVLYADMACADGDEIPLSRLIQPRIEGEVAFVLGRDLDGENLSTTDVRDAVEYAVAGFEIVDSRIADWRIRILDTISDNASSGLYVLGNRKVTLDHFEPASCEMVMKLHGKVVSTGMGAACLGDPLMATLWLARTMAGVGRPLRAGELVLSGALGPLVPVESGAVYDLYISELGSVTVTFSDSEGSRDD